MTLVDEPRRQERAAQSGAREGRAARRKVELRLATRQTRRAWTTSLLVTTLVAIPLVPMGAIATFLASRTPTLSQVFTSELGSTEAWFRIVGGFDPSREQHPGAQWHWVDVDNDYQPIHPILPPPDDLSGLIPSGTELLQVASAEVTVSTPGGVTRVRAYAGDAADARLEGRFELIDGRRPQNSGEALVSPGALTHLEAKIGDTLRLQNPAASFTIVGIMKRATSTNIVQSVFLPGTMVASLNADPEETWWFSPEWQPTASELPALNRAGVLAYARDLIRVEDTAAQVHPSEAWAMFTLWAIGGTFAAYLVILLAGAGFAVSARRQQRSLAVAASVGADKGSLFRVVLFQGTVLGFVGGVIGVAIGIGLALPVLNFFDDGAIGSFWGFHVPWWGIAGIVLFAVAIGTASALVPARAATRGDVLSSLRGSRKPARLRVDRPFWGSLIIAVGLATTVIGGLGLGALNAVGFIDYNNPMRHVYLFGIVAGPILFQIGAIVAGHWLLSLIAGAGKRSSLPARIATRDAAAHPGRTVPAFAAIAACVFLASFGLTATKVFSEYGARSWWYQAPVGSLVLYMYGDSSDPEVFDYAWSAVERTEPTAIAVVHSNRDWFYDEPGSPETVVQIELIHFTACDDGDLHGDGRCVVAAEAPFWSGTPYVVAAEDLEIVLGIEIDRATRERFAAGGALALNPDYLDEGHVVLNRWAQADIDRLFDDWNPHTPLPVALDTVRVPAQLLEPGQRLRWSVILSPLAAQRFDYLTEPRYLIAVHDEPPTRQQLDALAAAAGSEFQSHFSFRLEEGPPDSAPWLWLILGAAGVLILGAGGVALGLARVERRPDDATLAAVGAAPRIRRGIAFWQALTIVGIGTVTGTVAGLIPMWGISMMSNDVVNGGPTMQDAPWLWLALLAVALPLAIALVSWLIPPRDATLTRRTAIG